jgi:hypothetical protein
MGDPRINRVIVAFFYTEQRNISLSPMSPVHVDQRPLAHPPVIGIYIQTKLKTCSVIEVLEEHMVRSDLPQAAPYK